LKPFHNKSFKRISALSLIFSFYFTFSYATENNYPSGNYVGLDIRIQEVNPAQGVLRLVAIPSAGGDFGESLTNGAYLQIPLLFNFDVLEGNPLQSPSSGSIFGGQSLGVRLSGNEQNYPFDSYSANFFTSVQSKAASAETVQIPKYYVNNQNLNIPGYSVKATQTGFTDGKLDKSSIEADRNSGVAYLTWNIKRSNSTIFISILMVVLMILGGIVSLGITLSITSEKRPPSINVLVWLAAFLFALFQVRSQFPGNPAIGINIDRLIFFPVILLLMILIAVNVLVWTKRDDWDMENPIIAIRGKRK
jgi:hypothetical protein